MAAEKENQVLKNFYSVREHEFQKSVKERTETSLEKDVDGKIYHYEKFKSLIGLFRKFIIWEEESNDGKNTFKMVSIDLKDSEGNYECLQMYLSSQAADTLLKRIPNVDLTKEMKISIMKQEDQNNKEVVYDLIVIYQKDAEGKWKKVPYYWNKENPGKLPELKKVEINGATATDRSERMKFFEALCEFKNGEMADITTALKDDGKTTEDLAHFENEHDEFGPFINYKKAETKEK
jgi:hypothetical protein